MTGAAKCIISLLDDSETPVITASMYAAQTRWHAMWPTVRIYEESHQIPAVRRSQVRSRQPTCTHTRTHTGKRASESPGPRIFPLGFTVWMVAFRIDLTGTFTDVQSARCAVLAPCGPALLCTCCVDLRRKQSVTMWQEARSYSLKHEAHYFANPSL